MKEEEWGGKKEEKIPPCLSLQLSKKTPYSGGIRASESWAGNLTLLHRRSVLSPRARASQSQQSASPPPSQSHG